MRKLLLLGLALPAFFLNTGCKMAPSQQLGDTVDAKYFEPADTSAAAMKAKHKVLTAKDTTDIPDVYYIGDQSTHKLLQLLSYPTRKHTGMYAKSRHLKVMCRADIGDVVKVTFYIRHGKDSLVSRIEKPVTAQDTADKP